MSPHAPAKKFLNRDLHLFNLYTGVYGIFDKLPFVFLPLYLYYAHVTYAGIAMPALLFYILVAHYLLRIAFRFLGIPFLARFGIKIGIIVGVIGIGMAVTLLTLVPHHNAWFFILFIIASACIALHWYTYHIYYTVLSTTENRGKQFAVRQIFYIVMVSAFPIVSAVFIAHAGYEEYFRWGLPIALVAATLLIFCRTHVTLEDGMQKQWRFSSRLWKRTGIRLHFPTAWLDHIALLWLLVMYEYGVEIVTIGWLLTLRIAAQSAWQFLIGHTIDRGYRRWINISGVVLASAALFGQAFFPMTLFVIIALECLMAIGRTNIETLLCVILYNEGHADSERDKYWMLSEISFDLGSITSCAIIAILLNMGIAAKLLILLAIPMALIMAWFTQRHPWQVAEVPLLQPPVHHP